MSLVKEILKAPIERKLYTDYFTRLEYSYFPYNDFATARESAIINEFTVSEANANEQVTLVLYDAVSDFDVKNVNTEYIMFASDAAGLDSHAFQAAVQYMNENGDVLLLYGDEDEYNNSENIRMNPWFKPAWSPDTLLDYLYFGNAFVVRTSLLSGKEKDWDNIYALVLSVFDRLNNKSVAHIDYVLYHSHYLKQLFVGKNYDYIREKCIDTGVIKRMENATVSIVIPSKDNPEVLEKCITSVLRYTKGISHEIIVVDNGSCEDNKCKIEDMLQRLKQDLVSCENVENMVDKPHFEYVYKPQPFNFSRMCNQGAKESQGDYLLFLNDDIEVREGKWLEKMLKVVMRPHTGAVGAKLYYPNSMMIQHAGITNLRLGPVHKLQFKDDNAHYYMKLNEGVHNCLAVTGACLLVAKSKFNEVGGFCEELEVAFNDVDLCFRLYENGYHNAVCNNTHLWHYESLSRGADESDEKLTRLTSERELLYTRHPRLYATDPYYSDCMSTDILDTNYSFIYEYDYRDVTEEGTVLPFKKKIKEGWYNECLMISLEYAGSFDKFEDITSKASNYALVSGYAFVAGSDNSMFRRSIILKGEKQSFIIKTEPVYRPDLEINLDPEEYALMCGFSVKLNLKNLPEDTYRIAILAECGSSRLKLYKETGKYIRVNNLS